MTNPIWNQVDPRERAIVDRYIAEVPVKVGELARELGLVVNRSSLPPKISGLIKPNDEARSGYEIKVNKYELPERQRFTIAHEIAHFLLHKDDIRGGVVDSIMYRSALTSRKEAEANRLAALMVMPTGPLNAELERLGGQKTPEVADALSRLFKVSGAAMNVRLGIT